MTDPPVEVALCVVTFLRPVGLERLLGHLAALAVPPAHCLSVVVVDNDASGSARRVVDHLGAFPHPLRYVVEPARGISHARNRAIAEAGDAPWIAFVDDDDWPEPDWLERLLATQAAFDADVVLGPTTPIFETPPPAWVVDGRFFERERLPTGAVVPVHLARTGGVLIRRAALALAGDPPFPETLGTVGGEDAALFRQLAAGGARIHWDDEAIYHEVIPVTKVSARWLIARSYRIGVSRSLALVHVEQQGWGRRIKRLGAGAWNVMRGTAGLVIARGRVQRIRALQTAANGFGLAAGVFGLRYEEYRTVRGT